MKSTQAFKLTIQKYLENRGDNNPLFSETLRKEGKSIDDCITYILNTVKNSGNNGFTDDEVFAMAVHYYDEDTIEIGKPISNSNVVVNHHVEITEEEKKEAKQKALDQLTKESYEHMKKKPAPAKAVITKDDNKPVQQSLF